MWKEVKVEKGLLKIHQKASQCILSEVRLRAGLSNEDYAMDLITLEFEAYVLRRMNEVKEITVYRERPTFLDWLLRRRRQFKFVFNCEEVLKDPLELPDGYSVKWFDVKQKDC